MRIAIVTAVLGSAGGMGHVAEEHAARLAARGHHVTIFTIEPKIPETRPASHNYQVKYLKPRIRYGFAGWIPQLSKEISGFDIVHLHYPCIGAVRAVLAWKKTSVSGKLVVTYHMDLIGKGMWRLWFAWYGRLATPRTLRAADQVMVSSFDYAEHSVFASVFQTIHDKMSEVPFGVDSERFAPKEADVSLLKKLSIPADEPVILFVGGLDRAHYFKGVSVLLHAFSLLRKQAARVRLIIVGHGGLLKNYQELTKKLQIVDQVIFADQVSEEEKPAYYSIADVFVLPSTTRSEAFGLVLLEAQASGVPVIATDFPGVRTVIEDQKTGFLVSQNDPVNLMKAMAWILTHPDTRFAMHQAARRRVEKYYRWDVVMDELEQVYKNALNNV